MAGEQGVYVSDVSGMADRENQVAAALLAADDQIAHAESLDTEQRSEIYAILEAMKSDAQTHRLLLAGIAESLGGRQSDA